MKHLYFLLTVILLMTCTVKAQSQSDYKEFENCVLVDGLGYSLNETTKEASVVPHYATDKDGNELSEGYKGDVVVPESITVDGIDYKVTELEKMAFGMSDITSLKLPSTIRKMGFRSVDYCPELVKANLPASVEDIGERPFCSCPKLDDFTIEEGNKNYILESNMLMTADKTTLLHLFGESDKDKPVSVTVPSTVKTIRACALSLCEGVNEITLPEGLDSIGYMAFSSTSITTITIPSTVTHISGGFVLLSKNLREIIVSEGNRNYKIEGGAMYDTDKTMLYWVSPACTSLAIPETVTKVCEGAIENTALKALVIPKSVKEISLFAVSNNQQLKTLVIGNGLNVIEPFTFLDNNALQSIFVRGNQPVEMQQYAFYDEALEEKATLYVPDGTKELYAAAANWENFKNIKEYSLAGIDQHPGKASAESVVVDGIAYDLNREDMTATVVCYRYWDSDSSQSIELCPKYSGDIVIPEAITVDGVDYVVTEIGGWSLCSCKLASVSLPSTLKAIRDGAFTFVEQLNTLTIPASVETIEGGSLVFCEDLENIVIAEGNKNFVFSDKLLMSADKTKVYALIGASRAGSNVRVVVPSTVKSLEPMAMYGAYGMSSLTLPEGLERICDSALGCNNLTSIHIPASVTTIEEAFWFMEQLREVTVAEGNQNYTVKNGMLLTKDLTGLVKIPPMLDSYDIPETVTTIYGSSADLLNTKELVIPDGVKALGNFAFGCCEGLETVVVGSGVETWGEETFYVCFDIKSIYLRSENVVTPTTEPFESKIFETATLYVPAGTKNAYELDTYWGRFKNITEYTTTGISSVKTDSNAPAEQIYGIDGKRRDILHHGLNIVRSNGKAKKVIVK